MADVRFENITFHYGDKCILKNFSLSVEESQILCLVGPSGCGKTTLVRCLLGFIKPETGAIYVGDRCVFSVKDRIDVPPERRHIGVVFQDYAVWPHLTVLENILYPMKKMRMNRDEMARRAKHALEQVRMVGYENHLPSQLSGGQQQRVAIARALVSSDEVIVMDEPITNLDAKLREEMLQEIRVIQHDIGTTILYITHDQEAALQLCDKMAIMDYEGNLCQLGADEDIILRPANRFVFEFIGVSNFLSLVQQNGRAYVDVGEKFPLDDCPMEIFAGGQKMDAVRLAAAANVVKGVALFGDGNLKRFLAVSEDHSDTLILKRGYSTDTLCGVCICETERLFGNETISAVSVSEQNIDGRVKQPGKYG